MDLTLLLGGRWLVLPLLCVEHPLYLNNCSTCYVIEKCFVTIIDGVHRHPEMIVRISVPAVFDRRLSLQCICLLLRVLIVDFSN